MHQLQHVLQIYTVNYGHRWGLTEEWIDGAVRGLRGEDRRTECEFHVASPQIGNDTHTNVAYTDLGSRE
jgi:hypothetical protein